MTGTTPMKTLLSSLVSLNLKRSSLHLAPASLLPPVMLQLCHHLPLFPDPASVSSSDPPSTDNKDVLSHFLKSFNLIYLKKVSNLLTVQKESNRPPCYSRFNRCKHFFIFSSYLFFLEIKYCRYFTWS